MKRIYSIDFTRGLVMIIMALDHVRDFMHVHAGIQSPTDLATTTPLLFFTRWVTHLCAPIFVFLAGVSAYLSFKNSGDISYSRRFLLKRGLWLILLEFTIVNFGLFFDPGFHNLIFEVIGAIGFGFIILSLLIRLSPKTIGIAGLIIIFCHNLLPLIPFAQGSALQVVLSPFFSLGAIPVFPNHLFIIAYPPIPWTGIMLVGFGCGKLFDLDEDAMKKKFLLAGSAALLLFLVLRFVNIYGDPFPWSVQKTGLFSFFSFMNITKYPPSLLFCLVTLGIMFFILALGARSKSRIARVALVYGKVPLFYFVLHFYLAHIIMIVILLLQGFHWHQMDFASGTFGRPKGATSGIALWAVYLVWIAVVMILYKPCLWYGRYKAAHRHWWLKYI